MLEGSGEDRCGDRRSAMEEEANDAMECGVQFSRLQCAEVADLADFALPAELAMNLIQWVMMRLAEFSQAHPSVIQTAVATMPFKLQRAFAKYTEYYRISFK
jgi:hypothetical protein